MKIKKFNENNSNIEFSNLKIQGKTITYFSLFPLLRKLELERPGIKKRIWEFLCDEKDSAFSVYNGRIKNINLYFYGVGEEYPLKNEYYVEEVAHSKKIHPEAFVESSEKEIRIDLNLIWKVYEDEIEDPESFPVITEW